MGFVPFSFQLPAIGKLVKHFCFTANNQAGMSFFSQISHKKQLINDVYSSIDSF